VKITTVAEGEGERRGGRRGEGRDEVGEMGMMYGVWLF
jgi:hypothetical protein